MKRWSLDARSWGFNQAAPKREEERLGKPVWAHCFWSATDQNVLTQRRQWDHPNRPSEETI